MRALFEGRFFNLAQLREWLGIDRRKGFTVVETPRANDLDGSGNANTQQSIQTQMPEFIQSDSRLELKTGDGRALVETVFSDATNPIWDHQVEIISAVVNGRHTSAMAEVITANCKVRIP
jgi:hypothetical protein